MLGVLPAWKGARCLGVLPWGIPNVALLPALVSSSPGELALLAGAVVTALGSVPRSRLQHQAVLPL